MLDAFLCQQIQAVQQRCGFAAAMGFHHADQHVQPLAAQPLGFLQHGVGFAHPGTGAEENLQPTAGLFIGQRQQAVRVRALLFLIHHRSSFCSNVPVILQAAWVLAAFTHPRNDLE
ncbi:hypothetical protein D3C80_1125120 [compost metagenome]